MLNKYSRAVLLCKLRKWLLLEKRGFSISYVAWKEGDQLEVSAIVYSMPMTGGLLCMRWIVTDSLKRSSSERLYQQGLKDYAKENGALELLIKPLWYYQTFW